MSDLKIMGDVFSYDMVRCLLIGKNYQYYVNGYKTNVPISTPVELPSSFYSFRRQAFYKIADKVVNIQSHNESDEIVIYSDNPMSEEDIKEFIISSLNGTEIVNDDDSLVRVPLIGRGLGGFYSNTEKMRIRKIDFDLFETFKENDFEELSQRLTSGGLHILYGPPGTGKTSLITTLAKHLEDECVFVYPMVDVATDIKDLVTYLKERYGGRDNVVIMLEDKDDLLKKIPSDILDVSDGILSLIGTTNVSLLITSNAEKHQILNGIREGLKRPGRLKSFIEIPEYSEEFSQDLQIKLKLPEAPKTLAEVYNKA